MSSDILVLTRVVDSKDGRQYVIEAHITKHDENTGITWMKLFGKGDPDNFSHCYVDTIDAELIVNAMENYIRLGKKNKVDEFLRTEGRVAMDPVIFRMKLETAMGAEDLAGEEDLF